MKKLFFAAFIALVSLTASAQEKQFSLGAQLSYGSETERVGFGVKALYGLTDHLRLEGSFNHFFKSDYVTLWDANVNLHYQLPLSSSFQVYPLAGLTYMRASATIANNTVSDGKLGVNLGVGGQYELNDSWALTGELKYQIISNSNQLVPSVGLIYKF